MSLNIFISIFAGFISVFAPCIIPVLPGVLFGTKNDNKYRPLFIVIGLSISFISMGIVTSLFSSFISSSNFYIEKIGGFIIMVLGLSMIFHIKIFDRLYFLQKFKIVGSGFFSPILLGLSLGIIWIPCMGPILSSILALVALSQNMLYGIILLMFYSIGFSLPILILGYSSQYFRNYISKKIANSFIIDYIGGSAIFLLGLYILIFGSIGLLF